MTLKPRVFLSNFLRWRNGLFLRPYKVKFFLDEFFCMLEGCEKTNPSMLLFLPWVVRWMNSFGMFFFNKKMIYL